MLYVCVYSSCGRLRRSRVDPPPPGHLRGRHPRHGGQCTRIVYCMYMYSIICLYVCVCVTREYTSVYMYGRLLIWLLMHVYIVALT